MLQTHTTRGKQACRAQIAVISSFATMRNQGRIEFETTLSCVITLAQMLKKPQNLIKNSLNKQKYGVKTGPLAAEQVIAT